MPRAMPVLRDRGPAPERAGGPRFTAAPAASTRIVTAPGEECLFDWSDVSRWTNEWGLGDIQRGQRALAVDLHVHCEPYGPRLATGGDWFEFFRRHW